MRNLIAGLVLLMFGVALVSVEAQAADNCPSGTVPVGDVCTEMPPEEVKEIDVSFMCTEVCSLGDYLNEAVRGAWADAQSTGILADVVHLDTTQLHRPPGGGMIVIPSGLYHFENGPSGWKQCFIPTNYVENIEFCDGN